MAPPKIAVIGSFAVGMTMRSPELPVFGQTLLGTDFDLGPGGKGSNQAVATARLGADTSLVAIIGDDKLGEIADDLYAAEGVDTRHLSRTGQRPTGVGIIILNTEGDNFILLDMGANELMDADYVDQAEALITSSDVVMSVLEIPVPAAARAMKLGREHGKTTILNPAPAQALPREILPWIDYLTPNESELRILLDLTPDDPRPSPELAAELRRRGANNLIVTMGDQGTLVLTDTINQIVPGCRVDVVDTTGAGDAFNAGFAIGLGEGRDLIDAVRFGCAYGALACTKLGVIPSLATRDDADRLYRQQYG